MLCPRRNSWKPFSKTGTSGLGLNCSETAITSCNLWALRKARRKRPLWVRARRNDAHFERIIAQEITLNNKRIRRTTLATSPLSWIRFTISPPMKEATRAIFSITGYRVQGTGYRRQETDRESGHLKSAVGCDLGPRLCFPCVLCG